MGPYVVIVGDCAGERERHPRRTFPEALRLVRTLERVCGKQYAYFVVNTDRMDRDGDRIIDGLTDEERDEL